MWALPTLTTGLIASLPEWGEFCHTHGDTYAEALKNAEEVLELLIESALEEGEALPEVWKFVTSSSVN